MTPPVVARRQLTDSSVWRTPRGPHSVVLGAPGGHESARRRLRKPYGRHRRDESNGRHDGTGAGTRHSRAWDLRDGATPITRVAPALRLPPVATARGRRHAARGLPRTCRAARPGWALL